MADTLTIPADSNHEYQVRATVAGYEVDLVLDTGFVHDGCRIGVALDAANFREVRSRLRGLATAAIRSLDPEQRPVDSGIGTVSLVGLDGSEVETRIVNAGENLLGVCYFHHLTEFSVFWDLAGQVMIITRTGGPGA